MKKLFSILAIFLYFGFEAQSHSIDSLKRALSAANADSNKVFLLTKLANELSGIDFKQSVFYAQEGVELSEKIGFRKGSARLLCNLGSMYGKLKKNTEAESYFERAEKIAKQSGNQEVLKDFYDTYSLYFEGKKDYRNAYKYHVLFSGAQDSMGRLAYIQNGLSDSSNREKENEDARVKSRAEVSSRGNSGLNFLIVLFISTVAIMILWIGRTKLKSQEELSKQLLVQQEIRSRSVIEAEERERSRVARELNEEIGQQLSAAKLNISALQSFLRSPSDADKRMLQNAVNLLDDSVKGVRNVSHSMIPNVLIKSGLVSALREFVDKISTSGKPDIQIEVVGKIERLEQTKEAVLFRVIQETINNVVQHARASKVNIQLIKHEKELSVLVEDNGLGFDVETILKSNKGIGLKSIQSRVAFLNGTIFFDSRPTKGTTISMEIPM